MHIDIYIYLIPFFDKALDYVNMYVYMYVQCQPVSGSVVDRLGTGHGGLEKKAGEDKAWKKAGCGRMKRLVRTG